MNAAGFRWIFFIGNISFSVACKCFENPLLEKLLVYYKGMYKASITGPRNDSYVTLPLYKSKLGRNKLQHLLLLGMNLYVSHISNKNNL